MNDYQDEGRQDGDEPRASVMRWTYPDDTHAAQITNATEQMRKALEVARVDARRARQTDRTEDHLAAQNAFEAAKSMYQVLGGAFLDVELGPRDEGAPF